MAVNYLIPKPSVENAVNTGYKGTLIYSETHYSRNYYVLQKDTENAWWAIGMIAKVGRYDHPIIVSDQRKNVHTICDEGGGQSSAEYEMTYDGVTYYVSGYTPYATDTESGSLLKNNIIPYYSESTFSDTEAGYKSAGQKLLDLYVGSGGSLPGASTYKTSWVQRLIEGVWQKTFAFAHAKTVYTDYANKKTLADKLSEIDTEIGNKANKTEIPTELPANGGNSATVNGHTVKSDVPENAVFTDTVYDDTEVKEEIVNINSNLDEQGLINYAHDLLQGYNSIGTGEYVNNNNSVCTGKVSCNGGDRVTVKADKQYMYLQIVYFNASGTFTSYEEVSYSNYHTFTVPNGITYFAVNYYLDSEVTPSTSGNPKVYINYILTPINESLDEIKNDLGASNAGAHNSVYRGKYLGDSLTTEQKAQISAGTFNDLYIGDYWTIGEVNYRIAAFDYWLNSGDTNCTKHHVVIVPDRNLYNVNMNDTNITTGAYVGSKMYTENLAQAKTTITNAFGSENILSHREHLANATKSTTDPTYEIEVSWYDSTVELMNERMVHGADVFHNIEVNGAIPTNQTIGNSQLPLFALEPSRICNRASWWMRDVVSAESFAVISDSGSAGYNKASSSYGVRPAFAIKG